MLHNNADDISSLGYLWSYSSPFKIFKIATTASKSNKYDAQHGCAYKVSGYSFGKSLIDNL